MRSQRLILSFSLALVTPLALGSAARADRPEATKALWPTKGLKHQIQTLAKPVEADYSPMFPIWAAYPEKAAHFYFPAKEGDCYWIVGSGGDGVGDVDMTVFDGGDKTVQEDRDDSPNMKIHVCAGGKPGNYHVELKIKKGHGEVAMQVYRRGAAIEKPYNKPVTPTKAVAKPANKEDDSDGSTKSDTSGEKPAASPQKGPVPWPAK